MAGLSSPVRNALYNAVLRGIAPTLPTGIYVALSNGGVELSGGNYARVAATWSAPTNGRGSNTAAIVFPTASAAWVYDGFQLFDAASGGLALTEVATLDAPMVLPSGRAAVFDVGQLDVEITAA